MKIDILTIFPDQVSSFLSEGIFRLAQKQGVEINVHDLRGWTTDKHKTIDDRPFGGGPGMIMKVEPIFKALQSLKSSKSTVILTSAKGEMLSSELSKELSKLKHIILICGHYEGVDERVKEHLTDKQISIGNYVLSGGELPALVVLDSLLRHVPSVLGNPESLEEESHEEGIEQEYPQYTRPEDFKGWKVPEILLSGDHEKIRRWRKARSNGKSRKL
ncbi:tRNA (guanosine(37)-N1)-methyltransferase TrmD [Candidatus Dojkabacteria bacterium]|nr:tRNA (guanosine(37)-N1)-methyltransferase TrmD [Candidatus Dojkabacteria bacterium]